VHVVGFIIRMCQDARSSEYQIQCSLFAVQHFIFIFLRTVRLSGFSLYVQDTRIICEIQYDDSHEHV